VARNRKRAKDTRRTQPVAARRGDSRSVRPRNGEAERNGAPDPLAHAAPDAELVEAQLAAGRGDALGDGPLDEIDTPEEERELEELATAGQPAVRSGVRAAEVSAPASTAPARRVSPGSRLITFIQGSWAELQRVQWPDRRQVMQATSVVIGFVIIAGVYLGVADWAAGKIMDLILK
jgi:preprotein translocase subunit SecE